MDLNREGEREERGREDIYFDLHSSIVWIVVHRCEAGGALLRLAKAQSAATRCVHSASVSGLAGSRRELLGPDDARRGGSVLHPCAIHQPRSGPLAEPSV